MSHGHLDAFEACRQKVKGKTSESSTEEAILILTALEIEPRDKRWKAVGQSVQTLRKEVLDAIKRMTPEKAKQEYIRRAQNIR